MTQATYDPTQGAKVLSAWQSGAGGRVMGADAKNGLLALAVKAERLAMAHGFSVPTTDDNGAVGAIVGGAADNAKQRAASGDDAAIVYLATHNAIRRANAEILTPPPVQGASYSEADALDVEPVIAPALVAIIVIGVVAAVAAIAASVAWSNAVTVQEQTKQRIALANTALDAASSNNPNVRSNPDLWKTLQNMAGQEGAAGLGGFPWGTILTIGAVIVGGKFLLDYLRDR